MGLVLRDLCVVTSSIDLFRTMAVSFVWRESSLHPSFLRPTLSYKPNLYLSGPQLINTRWLPDSVGNGNSASRSAQHSMSTALHWYIAAPDKFGAALEAMYRRM